MLSDDIRRAIEARPEWKSKRRGDVFEFRCPRHDDGKPSAWMRGGTWGCHVCGFKDSITTLAPEVGVQLNGSGGYTLEDYADAKGFSTDTLRAWGLTTAKYEGRDVVRLPYYDEDGNELRARYRSGSGKWWEGRDRPIYLYGRDHLTDAEPGDAVLVVEGESDCHALWSAGILAVGVPGCNAWREEWAEHLAGLKVYVWEEPDKGGPQLVADIVQSFPDARIIRPDGVKDAAELRQQAGAAFADRIRDLMDRARPHGSTEPPVAFSVFDARRAEHLLEEQLAPIDAVPTPFPGWNNACRDAGGGVGLARGWHSLGAARTGHGKSILALNLTHAALRAGETVCFVSLEMAQSQVETRLLAIASGLPVVELEKGKAFNVDTFRKATAALQRLPGRFVTNRHPIHRLDQVEASIRAMHEIYGARFFVVDYIQLAANQNDPETITAASQTVRRMAQELNVVTFGLSQFNRTTSSANETPTVHGLTGGSSLENDADQIVLIDHTTVEEATHHGQRIGWDADLLLAKNRHGPGGIIPITFSSRSLQMRERLADEFAARPIEVVR